MGDDSKQVPAVVEGETVKVWARPNRQAILDLNDIERRTIPVPQWNCAIAVRSITALERDQIEQSMQQGKGKNRSVNLSNLRAKLVVAACEDDDGTPLFKPEDIPALSRKNAGALEPLVDAIMEMSGFSSDDVDKLTDELRDNPFDSRSTDSPTD